MKQQNRTPTREDELVQAIIPFVNAGFSVFDVFKLVVKANSFLRMQTYERLQTVLEGFYGSVDWTQYDGSYVHPPCAKDPKETGKHHWKCAPGKHIARCQFCGLKQS